MTWRLLYVRSGREYAVLAELVARKWDGYVPSETVWRGPAHKRVAYKRPMLPAGMLFADLDEAAFSVARFLPDVTGALRILCATGEETFAMDRWIGDLLAEFIEPMREQERRGEFDRTRKKGEGLTVGQEVRIIKGMFQGHMATITAIKGAHDVSVDVLNMGPTSIAAAKLEAVEAA